jgi:uncharacterized protein YyaL (SSP411 family)
MPNRLAHESSPYLLQHQHNPVDWYPWGEEALARSRAEQKPIFLSIGYSACHWCHVMERESFENESIAQLINENFVPVKVDREERPDLDQIYMNAVQLMTGHGGWPMSVFLTPDLQPFYGGTYWPPTASRGMAGFDQVLSAVAEAWQVRREQVLQGAEQMTTELRQLTTKGVDPAAVELDLKLLMAAGHLLERLCDRTYGGFGQAPKFPHSLELQLALRLFQRTGRDEWLNMVRSSLDGMAAGGIYDHLGGGFARYSVDARWLVPHFEKMLYDNAMLAITYLEAWQVTGEKRYRNVVIETLDYLLRDMTDPEGGFYSAEDADSEGEEGKFYAWSLAEVTEVLGEARATTFARVYDVTPHGNFEGANILHLPKTIAQTALLMARDASELEAELADCRAKLLERRSSRVRPGRDDKVLVAWNSLAIEAFARAGVALEEPRYVEAARRAADFILTHMRTPEGRLLHTWRAGRVHLSAYLDDYTGLAAALVPLYQATFDERYVAEAVALIDTVRLHFNDPEAPGFYFTANDHEELLLRSKDLTDNATPGGNSLAVVAVLRLGTLLGRSDYLDLAESILQQAAPFMQQMPMGAGQMLLALDFYLGPSHSLVFTGEGATQEGLVAQRRFLPRAVVAAREADARPSELLDPKFADRDVDAVEPHLWVCEGPVCQAPVVGRGRIAATLGNLT